MNARPQLHRRNFVATLVLVCSLLLSVSAFAQEKEKRRIPALAFGLNFIVPGAGYLYNGEKPLYVSLPMIAAAGGLTYVENFHKFGDAGEPLLKHDQTAFLVLFGSVFVLNTALGIDALLEARAINRRGSDANTSASRWRIGVMPRADQAGLTGASLLLGRGF